MQIRALGATFKHLLVNSGALRHFPRNMACSRFEYVKTYEQDDKILPNVWIVIRIDGKKFHHFANTHKFEKPNDENALNVMNAAGIAVMQEFKDIVVAYGQSDEYSFVFRKDTMVYKRRASKLLTYVTSQFTSSYVLAWSQWMQRPLAYAPCFDGRVVLYPTDDNMRDYLSWRQADVHVNNLYNTAFWKLVQSGLTNQQAEEKLRGTLSAAKNELLFTEFGINYNNVPAMYRKGTILMRKRVHEADQTDKDKGRQVIVPLHEDLIGAAFWKKHSEILGKYVPGNHELDSTSECKLLAMQLGEKLKIEAENS
ncbi:probable tRNA(His) guanylyltransferase [Drosophila busckii]|uniref:probable tRNA(His) guanylyltransferase n=1 Tax=Drosophila busckii TaxID=30019 RepID=UPI00143302A9|nr:probable tRNA(His) guanylyltransferase [Drosophila busckii]